MTIFASRDRINTDPTPYYIAESDSRHAAEEVRTSASEGEHGGIISNLAILRPRPEFDRPRTHPTNGVLVRFRDEIRFRALDWAELPMIVLGDALDVLAHHLHGTPYDHENRHTCERLYHRLIWDGVTREEAEHAHRVIDRLLEFDIAFNRWPPSPA